MKRLIDADKLKKHYSWWGDVDHLRENKKDFDTIIDLQPTVDAVPLEDYRSMEQTVHKLTQAIAEAEPKHGRWLPSDKGDCTYTCSECGFVRDAYILEEKAYCPRCGADMREVKE